MNFSGAWSGCVFDRLCRTSQRGPCKGWEGDQSTGYCRRCHGHDRWHVKSGILFLVISVAHDVLFGGVIHLDVYLKKTPPHSPQNCCHSFVYNQVAFNIVYKSTAFLKLLGETKTRRPIPSPSCQDSDIRSSSNIDKILSSHLKFLFFGCAILPGP
jgi:hypothetical protein